MTKSSTFVRCWLGFSNTFYNGLFHDCYISIEPEKLIHIVLKKDDSQQYEEISQQLKDHKWFLKTQTTGDYVIFDFEIAEEREDDFDKFIVGQYSKLSDSAKELILMSHEKMDNIKNLAVILYPEKRHRDMLSQALDFELNPNAEVYDRPDITKELLPKEII